MELNHSFYDICNSQFWNENLTWHNEDPDFTTCFQQTALIWGPCAFLWLFSVFDLYYIRNSINRNIPWSFLNITKTILTTGIIALTIIDLVIVAANQKDNYVYPVDFYTPTIKLATFILSFILLQCNRKFGLRISGLQFIFWMLLVICGVPHLRTLIRERQTREDLAPYYFTSYLIFFVISTSLWFLNWFADIAPLSTKYAKSDKPCPELSASYPSRLFFDWFDPLAWLGYRKPLEYKDLWDIRPDDSSEHVMSGFLKYWNITVAKTSPTTITGNTSYKQTRTSASVNITTNKLKKKASIMPALFKAFGSAFLFGVILQFLHDILMFAPPQILRLLIQFVDSSSTKQSNDTVDVDEDDTVFISRREPLWRGIFYAILLFVVAIIQTILTGQFNQRLSVVALRIRTAIIGVVYRKALVLSNSAKKETATGEIVNLMAVDAQCFMDLLIYVNSIWSAPLQIILALYFLWGNLGPSVLAGLAVMILLIPVSNFFITKLNGLEYRQRKNKDGRVKLMNEILGGIKVLKLNAWEPSFTEHILKIRDKELKILKQYAVVYSGTSFVWLCAPFLVSIVTFVTYIYTGDDHVLTAEKAFVCLTLFDIIKLPLGMLPLTIAQMTQARVSINRINEFLNREELDPSTVTHDSTERSPLVIENGTFTWGDEEPILKNINIQVKKQTLVAVVGGVGSGKSSLISAFLGEMDKTSGRVNTVGKIAYVTQQAWIQDATLQDNILFGRPMDRKRYDEVVAACALKDDLKMLAKGDQTEIGEKGTNVSGGQKQRIAIARAVYADADIYFLDDPLSAVDSHVGKHIFEQVIGPKGLLANKTRVLVTHGVIYLKQMKNIFVLSEGKITESGNLQELLHRKGAFAEFLHQHLENVKEEENLDEIKEELENTLKKTDSTDLLSQLQRVIGRSRGELNSETASLNGYVSAETTVSHRKSLATSEGEQAEADKENEDDEETEEGSVKWAVYKHYLKSFGVAFSVLTVVLIIVFQAFSVGSNMWISRWSSDKSVGNDTAKRDMYIAVYAAFGVAQAIAVFISTLSLFLCALGAARYLHSHLLHNILRAPTTTFFDVTPTGRILNRFSSDVNCVDSDLPAVFHSWAFCFFRVLATFAVISISVYWFLIVTIPVGILYYFAQRIYISTSRQLKRLEATSLSPVYSHFSESIQGASTIRAFNVSDRFIVESGEKVDFNQVCYYPKIISERWLAVRLELIGNFIILFAALFAVLSRDTIDPGTVGLCILYALQITQDLHTIVNMNSMVEMTVVSVERIKQYSDVEPEAPWDIPNQVLPKNWPEMGKIQFKNYDLRYRKGLDLILRDVTFTINSGERVGIVGRTGAGKSTLTLALFRIVEAAGGKIFIDGQDISKLGLHILRSKLTIIPQDPVLFSGSLRLNLDPTGSKTDTEIWKSLELANLQTFTQGLTAGLNHEVTEGGENLSVGQRQLVCLARALLRKTKLLILDEATAAVDLETDELVQKTIKSEFKDCTILTIAHRLNTILDSDKVIVMDKGRVIEVDSPSRLLADPNTIFYSLAKDADLV